MYGTSRKVFLLNFALPVAIANDKISYIIAYYCQILVRQAEILQKTSKISSDVSSHLFRVRVQQSLKYTHIQKGSVNLIQRVKIAHSLLQFVSNLFHFIILS